jgi:hypothetical protein
MPRDATITPEADGTICEEPGCDAEDLLATVDPDGDHPARTLCPTHRVAYLREVADA